MFLSYELLAFYQKNGSYDGPEIGRANRKWEIMSHDLVFLFLTNQSALFQRWELALLAMLPFPY